MKTFGDVLIELTNEFWNTYTGSYDDAEEMMQHIHDLVDTFCNHNDFADTWRDDLVDELQYTI